MCMYMMHGPCIWSVHDPNTVVYTAVHGRVPCTRPFLRHVYTAMHSPCTWSVHDQNTAVHGCAPCTRACLRPVYTAVHGMYGLGTRPYITRTRPCARPRTVHTVVFTACVHGRKRTVYTAAHGPRTIHRRVPCTRSSLRPVYTAVHGRVWTLYTAMHEPCISP